MAELVELEAPLTLEERLEKQRWFVGEMTSEAAEHLLSSGQLTNCFVVYSLPDTQDYTLTARFPLEDVPEGIIEHLPIHCEEGKYCITGQTEEFDDIIEAVNYYVLTSDPPLMPALQGHGFEAQVSLRDAPPDYDNANRVLKPDIAPLPDIAKVKVADKNAVEAESGCISPTVGYHSTSGVSIHFGGGGGRRSRPPHMNRSIWHRYREHNRCHPKNVCYGCCYRPEEWSGYSVYHPRKWYNPRGSGLLRFIGLLLFWLFCWPFFGCAKFCSFCCICICALCCGYYDSS